MLDKNQEISYIHTNGLSSFISSSVNTLNTRKEHSSYMITLDNPSTRINVVSEFSELINTSKKDYLIGHKEYLDSKKNYDNLAYLKDANFDYYPIFTYEVDKIKYIKRLCYKHETNNLEVEYEVVNNSKEKILFNIIPTYKFSYKGDDKSLEVTKSNYFKVLDKNIYYYTDLEENEITKTLKDVYYSFDKRDGRGYLQDEYLYHFFSGVVDARTTKVFRIYYTLEDDILEEDYFSLERDRVNKLLEDSGFKHPLTKRLYLSSLDYLAKREGLTTIVAGYPFFNDWGRDTMISVVGLIMTHHFNKAREVFDSFIKYLKDGLMPNMFPDKDSEAIYNTVDASLLFVEAIYKYYQESNDLEYIKKVMPSIKEILDYYSKGTLFNIHMDKDYLLIEGNLLNQLTWMDVRVNDILPTARHGKPVEINALWYNAFMVYSEFCKLLNLDDEYSDYPSKIKESFNKKFFNGKYLLDYIDVDDPTSTKQSQIRSNMSLALSYSFKVVDKEKALVCLETIKDELLTDHGLRSLSPKDADFKAYCRGSNVKRDLAYHEGTVWPWTTASFYLAYLEYNDYSKESLAFVKEHVLNYSKWIKSGCLNHIAEIYDGGVPDVARGCFAQSWSDSEILRVLIILERQGVLE